MKTSTLIVLIVLSFNSILNAQIDANSLLSIPTVSSNAEMTGISSPSSGSLVYHSGENKIYVYDGTSWAALKKETNSFGDIKYGVQSADHNGWYLLNGRATSTLSTAAQTNATNLGFTTNLPNAQDRVLKHPSATDNIGDTGGQTTTTLSQNNLPNVNFTGSTSTDGNHTHTIPRTTGSDQVRHSSDDTRTFYNSGGTTTTSTSGNHSHTVTVSSGGTGQSFERYQPYLVVNTFIYLGL